MCSSQIVSPCSSTGKEFAGKYKLYVGIFEIYVLPIGRGFSAEKCYLPPLLSEFLMLGFYEVGRGAFSYCLHRTPIFVLIHYLLCTGTHKPRSTHSPHLLFALTHKYFRVADILTAVSLCDLKPLTPLTPNATVLTLCLFGWQVTRGHEGVGGPGCCSEQLKQTWAKTPQMASVGSASSTSPSSYTATTTGYLKSTSLVYFNL